MSVLRDRSLDPVLESAREDEFLSGWTDRVDGIDLSVITDTRVENIDRDRTAGINSGDL